MIRRIPRLWHRLPPPRRGLILQSHPTPAIRALHASNRYLSQLEATQTRGVDREQQDDDVPDKDGITKRNWRHAKKEIVWLQADQASLAQRVQTLLHEGNQGLALALTRLASKDKDEGIVPWNLLIKHRMDKEPLPHYTQALSYFNEMKKRGQTPDSYTYGAIFSGFDNHPRPTVIVDKAYEMFQRMQKDSSPVKPNIMHMNKMISIAAKSGKMSIFWQILQTIPESGPDAASAKTYTFIFNSLRNLLESELQQDLSSQDMLRRSQELQDAGRAIWGAAIEAWTQGEIALDSQLICSYGNLLISSPQSTDWELVLSLIEQTTGIRRPHAFSGLKSGWQEQRRRAAAGQAENQSPAQAAEEIQKVFKPVKDKPHAILVKPTNHILSLSLKAVGRLRRKLAADYYWDIMTGKSGHRLVPDRPNIKDYLLVLRIFRSSKEAVKLITSTKDLSQLDFGSFRLAMSTCERNGLRPGTCSTATELYRFRQQHFDQPDSKVIQQFTRVIEVATDDVSRIEALTSLGTDPITAFKSPNMAWILGKISPTKRQELHVESIKLSKNLIGIYDSIEKKGLVYPSTLKQTKSFLAELVRSYNHGSTTRNHGEEDNE